MKINDFAEANKYLAGFYTNIRPNYTLDIIRGLLELLGNPQDTLKIVHIAGTSGKTSTAYYVSALLTSAGYKTGLTVSPHVDEINERVQINTKPLSEEEFCTALTAFAQVIESSALSPSWFEVMVAFAYWYFARESVDYAVIEVGLGGLLDGTNVVSREDKTCVITDIGFDHTQILGNTLGEIAAQKAGIIQQNNDVIIYDQNVEVMQVVKEKCASKNATLHIFTEYDHTLDLPDFQKRNLGLAVGAVNLRFKRDGQAQLTSHEINEAARTYIPGRMEEIKVGDKTVILDGAHNSQKLSVLAKALHVKYPNKHMAILVAFAEGDQYRLSGALDAIKEISDNIIVTSFVTAKDNIKHSVNPIEVQKVSNAKTHVEPNPAKAYALLLEQKEQVLVVAGSFYLLNHIRPLMLKA